MKRIYKNAKLADNSVVDLITFGREGFKSPVMVCYYINGRLVTPFEIRIRNLPGLTLNSFFRLTYEHILEELIVEPSLFLQKIKTEDKYWRETCFLEPIPFKID